MLPTYIKPLAFGSRTKFGLSSDFDPRPSCWPLLVGRSLTMDRSRPLELFVPGRICLMGEHSDGAGSYRRFNKSIEPGLCRASGTNQGRFARVWPHPSKLGVSSVDHLGNVVGPQEFSMEPALLASVAAEGGQSLTVSHTRTDFRHMPRPMFPRCHSEFCSEVCLLLLHSQGHFAYVCGVAYQIAVRYNCQGLVIENYKTDLPQSKGLSSSAAATVLAARACMGRLKAPGCACRRRPFLTAPLASLLNIAACCRCFATGFDWLCARTQPAGVSG